MLRLFPIQSIHIVVALVVENIVTEAETEVNLGGIQVFQCLLTGDVYCSYSLFDVLYKLCPALWNVFFPEGLIVIVYPFVH